ncbi:MAG: phosphate starvation-inducible protein PhoH, partial [Tidjanibacter sp.]|nr:phosphate starvation-inducible protein PhoH [Tidjanibacter sp.]
MAERNIYIEGIDLLDFYGTANVNLEKLGAMMPKLKIIARGSTLKAIGTDDDIKHFESRVNALLDYYAKYGHISPDVIEQIFSKGIASPASLGDAIVYGNGGIVVKARTESQEKLVKLYNTKDLLFEL